MTQTNPSYVAGPPIDAAKMYVSAVILPDGRVLQTGGATGYRMNPDSTFVRTTQILDPKTMQWAKAPDAIRRPHLPLRRHPAARRPGADLRRQPARRQLRDEPRDLLARVHDQAATSITSAPVDVTLRRVVRGRDQRADRFRGADPSLGGHALVGLGPAQRGPRTSPNATPSGATLTVPANRNLTPPGWYMLFARNASGAPSVAKWVKVS